MTNNSRITFKNRLSEEGVYSIKENDNNIWSIINIHCDNDRYKLTSSSGNSVIIMPDDKEIVIKVYFSKIIFNKVYSGYNMGDINHNAFVMILACYPNYNSVVMERLIPVISDACMLSIVNDGVSTLRDEYTQTQIDKIYNDCFDALALFEQTQFVHNDFTMDNVGYSVKRDKYVLFDFDDYYFKDEKGNRRDCNSFSKTLEFHDF
jgi:hypothetical protein